MRQTPRDIIQRAKQLPRQGTADPGLLAGLDAGLKSILETFALYNDSSVQTVNATGKMAKTFDELATAFTTNTDKVKWLEKRNQSLQKTFMLTRKDAANFGQSIDKLSKDFGVGGKAARAYVENLQGIAKGFAGSSKFIESSFGKQMIKIQDDLVKTLGLSKETANAWTSMQVGRGGDLDEELKKQVAIGEAIKQATGYQDAQREIIEGMAGLSADIEAHYNRIPGSLELGILKAKQMGLTVEDIYNAGAKFLNVEETIGKELELQALTGQRLLDQDGESLINKYQQAHLNGDINAEAEALAAIMEKVGDDVKTNPYARQALADLTGLSTTKLAEITRSMALMDKVEGGQELFATSVAGIVADAETYKNTLEDARVTKGYQSTDQIQEDEKDKAETSIINEGLGENKAGDLVDSVTFQLQDYIKTLGTQISSLTATTLPLIKTAQGVAETINLGNAMKDQWLKSMVSLESGATTITADNVLVQGNSTATAAPATAAPGKYADGGVVPAGYPNDTYPALLTSGETVTPAGKLPPNPDMTMFATAIVNAIRQQTAALTNTSNNTSMNPPLWA